MVASPLASGATTLSRTMAPSQNACTRSQVRLAESGTEDALLKTWHTHSDGQAKGREKEVGIILAAHVDARKGQADGSITSPEVDLDREVALSRENARQNESIIPPSPTASGSDDASSATTPRSAASTCSSILRRGSLASTPKRGIRWIAGMAGKERLPTRQLALCIARPRSADQIRTRYLIRLGLLPPAVDSSEGHRLRPQPSSIIPVAETQRYASSHYPRDASMDFLSGWCM